MNYITCTYTGNSRELRKIIVILLRSGFVDSVKKMNYVHTYEVKNNKVIKNGGQLILVGVKDEKQFLSFLTKNFPQIERIYLS